MLSNKKVDVMFRLLTCFETMFDIVEELHLSTKYFPKAVNLTEWVFCFWFWSHFCICTVLAINVFSKIRFWCQSMYSSSLKLSWVGFGNQNNPPEYLTMVTKIRLWSHYQNILKIVFFSTNCDVDRPEVQTSTSPSKYMKVHF